MFYSKNHMLRNSITLGDGSLRITGISNFQNLLNAEFSCRSALGNFILVVYRMIANKQMRWVNAFRIIAFVQNMAVVWNFLMRQLVRKTMSAYNFFANSKSAISHSFFVRRGRPFPTFVGTGNFDFCPKSLNVFVGVFHHADNLTQGIA